MRSVVSASVTTLYTYVSTMTIPAAKIFPYLDGLTFPAPVFDEQGNKVSVSLTRKELVAHLLAGEIVATGTRRHIKRLRFCAAPSDARTAPDVDWRTVPPTPAQFRRIPFVGGSIGRVRLLTVTRRSRCAA